MRGSKGLLIWILQVTALFTLLLFFLWLILRPSEPTYTLTNFSISATNITFTLEISNTNFGGGIHYGEANVTLSSTNVRMGGVTVPSFYQGRDRCLRWEGSVRVGRSVREAVAGHMKEVRVGLVARVGYRVLVWEMRPRTLDLEAVVPIDRDGRVFWNGRRIRLRRTGSRNLKV